MNCRCQRCAGNAAEPVARFPSTIARNSIASNTQSASHGTICVTENFAGVTAVKVSRQ